MLSAIPKHDLIKKYLDGSLYIFLLKQGYIKKGDTFTYGELLNVTVEDFHHHFEVFGYPGLKIGRHDKPRNSPNVGRETETQWTFDEDTYTVWYTDRGIPTPEFSTKSKEEFEEYWKKIVLEEFYFKLSGKHAI